MIYKEFDSYKIGEKIISRARTITETDVVTYCYLTGNWFQLHSDAEYSKKTIYVCGCSYTVGAGLHFEDTWSQQFKKYLAEHMKYELKEINLLNFAVGGHSNDYISRILLTQCSIIKPDLVKLIIDELNCDP